MWKLPFDIKAFDIGAFDKKKALKKTKIIVLRLIKIPMFWAAFGILFIYFVSHIASWNRQAELNDVLNNSTIGAICLGNENPIYERRGISKSYAVTDRFIRFDKQTFSKDFLKKETIPKGCMAVVLDINGVVYWADMSEQQIKKLSAQYKVDVGTCKTAKDFHKPIPGTAVVTNP
jgi:hypothetical protein